jgi:hypothetical protein
MMLPPWNWALELGMAWYMKIGRSSVSDLGSSK